MFLAIEASIADLQIFSFRVSEISSTSDVPFSRGNSRDGITDSEKNSQHYSTPTELSRIRVTLADNS